MKNRTSYLLIIMAITCLILSGGCATTNTAEEDAQNPTTISEEEPKNAEVSEFILGAGDTIEITVYKHDELKKNIQIDSSGIITYPLVGDIQTSGLSILRLRDKIRDGLTKYINNPQVSVGITAIKNQKVIVLGEVSKPGYFQIESSLSALDAISQAGGFTLDGKQKSVILIRGGINKPGLVRLDLEKALKQGDLTQNVMLQRGDIIYVPRTYIADVNRFFSHLATIISPLLSLESGYFIGQQIENNSSGATVPVR